MVKIISVCVLAERYRFSEESERSVPDVGRSGGYFRRTAAGIIDTGDGAAGFSGIVEVQRAAL